MFLLRSKSMSVISLFWNSIQTSLVILINLYISYIRCLPFSSEEIVILAIYNLSFPKGYYLPQSEKPNEILNEAIIRSDQIRSRCIQ